MNQNLKLKSILFSALIIAVLSSCNHQVSTLSLPQNNWTDSDKNAIKQQIKTLAQSVPYPEINQHVDEISDETIKDVITNYPDVNDFNKHREYLILSFSKIGREKIPKQ
jgi:hypothetical protein